MYLIPGGEFRVFDMDFFKVISEIVRPGASLFLMITGALLLNRDIELGSFLKKKWVRLCYPFIFYYIIRVLVSPGFPSIFTYSWYFWMVFCLFLAFQSSTNSFCIHQPESLNILFW